MTGPPRGGGRQAIRPLDPDARFDRSGRVVRWPVGAGRRGAFAQGPDGVGCRSQAQGPASPEQPTPRDDFEEDAMFANRVMRSALVAAALAVAIAAPATAAEEKAESSVRSEMMFWITDAENKLLELAEATPEEGYTYRPAEGVRSVAEVFMHVAGANYGIPSFWGVAPPEGFKIEGWENSLTKKADIHKTLKDSFAHMKKSFGAADEAALAKPIEFFGMKSSVRGAYMLLLSHAHEHLGQSIAYARMNGITPPWTARQNAAIEAAKEKAKQDPHAGHKH
jgi:uncharacterized damage-inducible protein DinB